MRLLRSFTPTGINPDGIYDDVETKPQMRKLTLGVIAIITVLLFTAGAFTMATVAHDETDDDSEEMTEMDPEDCQEMMGDGMMGENGMMGNGMMNNAEMGCH